jgi:HEAT repeat protein
LLAFAASLAMLHPYPRQSLFGPTIRGKPWCVWEGQVRWNLDWEQHERTRWAKTMRWFGVAPVTMDDAELFDHPDMAPLLLHMTRDADPAVRRGVTSQFFWHKNLQDKSAVPILRERLDDTDPDCRIEAAMALAVIDADVSVVPVLVRILEDPRSWHRYNAVRALAYIAHGNDVAFDALRRYAKDPDHEIRQEIMFNLFRSGKKGVPTLLQALDDPTYIVRQTALQSLCTIGPDAKDAVPVLQKRLDHPNKEARDFAAEALSAIEPERFGHLRKDKK